VRISFLISLLVISNLVVAQPLTVSQAKQLLADWEGKAEMDAEQEGEEGTIITTQQAVILLWQGIPNRRRLGSVFNDAKTLWQEAWERGWLEPSRDPKGSLSKDEFYELYLASRDVYSTWQEPHHYPGFKFDVSNRLFLSVGPPADLTLYFAGRNGVGLRYSDGEETYLNLSGGLNYYFSEFQQFFIFSPQQLWVSFFLGEPFTWYRFLSLKLGRLEQGGGSLYQQLLDGFVFKLQYSDFLITLNLGYLGLLPKDVALPLITPNDLFDFMNAQNNWGPPRMLSSLVFHYQPNSGLWVNLALAYMGDFRLGVSPDRVRQEGETTYTVFDGGLYQGWALGLSSSFSAFDLFKLELALNFQNGGTLHYDAQAGKYIALPFLGLAFDVKTELLLPGFDYVRFLRLFLSSGDGSYRSEFQEGSIWNNGPSLSFQYRSWGHPPPLRILKLDWGNLAGFALGSRLSLSSFIPISYLSWEYQLGSLFRLTDGPVSDPSVTTGPNASPYLGTEIYTQLVWEPWAELGVILGLGFAVVNQKGAYPDDLGPILGHLSIIVRFDR